MISNQKTTGRAMTIPAGAALGAGLSMLWTFLLAGILAWMIQKEYLKETMVGYGSMMILLSASWIGAKMATGKVKRQKFITAASAAGIYLLSLLAMTALFFGGQYSGIGVTGLLILGGSGITALPGSKERKTNLRKVRKNHY